MFVVYILMMWVVQLQLPIHNAANINLECDYDNDVKPYFNVCAASDEYPNIDPRNELIFPNEECYYGEFIDSLSFTASIITSEHPSKGVEAELFCRSKSIYHSYDFEMWLCKESKGEAHLLKCMCPHTRKTPGDTCTMFNTTTSDEVSLNYRLTIYENSSDSYYCLVQYSGGKWVHGITEVKVEQPYITKHPENVTIIAGKSSTLSCKGSGFPPPQITWMKSGQELGFSNSSHVVTTSSDGVSWLYMNETLPQDEGFYNCIASNILGQTMSRSAELTVMTGDVPTGQPLNEPSQQPGLSMEMTWVIIGSTLLLVIMIIGGITCYVRRRHKREIVHIHGNVSTNNFTVNAEKDARVNINGGVKIGREDLADRLEAEIEADNLLQNT